MENGIHSAHYPAGQFQAPAAANSATPTEDARRSRGALGGAPNQNPNSAEASELSQLKARDREVRAHERAHLSAAGGLARGGANFHYQRGSDGRLYATGGEVSIDTSAVAGDPQATLQKAETVRRAALAPTDPSAQDRRVAAEAAALAAKARLEIQRENGQVDADQPSALQRQRGATSFRQIASLQSPEPVSLVDSLI